MRTKLDWCHARMLAALPAQARQRGAAAVEFALGAFIFFGFIFFMIEMARGFYLWNTMVDVTSRAARMAAYSDFRSATQLALRRNAIFDDAGGLPLGGSLNEANLKIDYLNGSLTPVASVPDCPEQNMVNCYSDPDGPSCVRFVRVRLCASGGADCAPVPYVPIMGDGFLPAGAFKFPTYSSIKVAGTLGYSPGAASTCP